MCKSRINKIIPMSLVDGPGNRTSIFFQECNLNCKYCHNPETINNCINCGICVETCPVKALSLVEGKVHWDRNKCVDCDTCIKKCPNNASPKIYDYSVEELVKIISDNIPFIEGITTSGGECMLQYKFLTELFKEVKKLGLTTLVDSNGRFPVEITELKELLDVTDGFMIDIKAFDRDEHIKLTGKDNDLILKNTEYLANIGKLDEIRTVLLDGADNMNTVKNIAALLKPYLPKKQIRYKLISYRPFGVREEYLDLKPVKEEEKLKLKEYLEKEGFKEVILI